MNQPIPAAELTSRLKATAAELGFSLAGACPAVSPAGFSRLAAWLEAGFAGEMGYLGDRLEAYQHPGHVLDGVRGLLLLGLSYHTSDPAPAREGEGRVSRYAWGREDYHNVIHRKLRTLSERVRQWRPGTHVRGVVDTAPLLEREFAQRAGLGWIGKNTLLLSRHAGSWFFLAALLLDCELEYDEPSNADHCGTCRACLDACPTEAFPEPYVLDATRCISYLTIELRGPIPATLRPALGDWIFGCDICQEVCPWNRPAPAGDATFLPQPTLNPLALAPLFTMDDSQFRALFRKTPLWRARRRGLLRNAAIVLGNHGSPDAASPLAHGLRDPEPIVRGASAWALGRLASPAAQSLLRQRLADESDPTVLHELLAALRRTGFQPVTEPCEEARSTKYPSTNEARMTNDEPG